MAAMENDFENTTISLYGTVPDSIVDGPGLRYAVFVQGCSHGCPGCHNPESQPAEGGTETTLAALLADIRANGLVHDVTLSGGEPFEQPKACAALAAELKRNGYGVPRVGTQSVTERVTVRFNWNASTTIQKGQAYPLLSIG